MRKIWGKVEAVEIAKLYLRKKMPEESFPTELSFLKGINSVVPDRVKDLNLFMDSIGLIRSEGRMKNAVTFSQELVQLVALG